MIIDYIIVLEEGLLGVMVVIFCIGARIEMENWMVFQQLRLLTIQASQLYTLWIGVLTIQAIQL